MNWPCVAIYKSWALKIVLLVRFLRKLLTRVHLLSFRYTHIFSLQYIYYNSFIHLFPFDCFIFIILSIFKSFNSILLKVIENKYKKYYIEKKKWIINSKWFWNLTSKSYVKWWHYFSINKTLLSTREIINFLSLPPHLLSFFIFCSCINWKGLVERF